LPLVESITQKEPTQNGSHDDGKQSDEVDDIGWILDISVVKQKSSTDITQSNQDQGNDVTCRKRVDKMTELITELHNIPQQCNHKNRSLSHQDRLDGSHHSSLDKPSIRNKKGCPTQCCTDRQQSFDIKFEMMILICGQDKLCDNHKKYESQEHLCPG